MGKFITTTATTTNNTNALNALTANIRRYAVMTPDEEVEKFAEYAAAHGARREAIKNEIVCANLRFALSIAKKYTKDGDEVCSLVSLATMGLMDAVDTFDVSLGYRFISHAVHSIRGEFSRYFRTDANFVRKSNNAKVGSKDKEIRDKFFQTEHREPTEDEIIAALKEEYGVVIVDKTDVVSVRTSSLDARVSTDDEGTVAEVGEIAIATATTNEFVRQTELEQAQYEVSRLLSCLSVREQNVVCRKFGIGYESEQDLDAIGEALGYTAERCRQLLKSALAKMKAMRKSMRMVE